MSKIQKIKIMVTDVNLSKMPLDFKEFERWISERIESNYNNANVLLKVYFGRILYDSLVITFSIPKFTALLGYNHYQEYYFIFNSDQKCLIQIPNDNGLYLDFFKDIYEIFTRYHRLDSVEKDLFNHIMRVYVNTTIRNIAAPHSNTYISWKQYQHAVKFVRKLLEKNCFDKIVEICRRALPTK